MDPFSLQKYLENDVHITTRWSCIEQIAEVCRLIQITSRWNDHTKIAAIKISVNMLAFWTLLHKHKNSHYLRRAFSCSLRQWHLLNKYYCYFTNRGTSTKPSSNWKNVRKAIHMVKVSCHFSTSTAASHLVNATTTLSGNVERPFELFKRVRAPK